MKRLLKIVGIGIVAALAIAAVGCEPGGPEPILIAHRGASGLAPEHTFAAYDRAVESGADYIEHDLQLTRDGVLVVLHDETLERTARGPAENCTGVVGEKTLAQLETCDFGRWFAERHPEAPDFAGQGIATLDAVLARYGDVTRYYIETKQPEAAPGMEEALLAVLGARGQLPSGPGDQRVIVQSFSPASLRKLHGLNPDLPLVQLFERGEIAAPLDETFTAVARYAIGVGPNLGEVDADFLAAAHRHGLVVHPWTVNSEEEMVRLLRLGVDGVFTDYPDRFVEVRGGRAR